MKKFKSFFVLSLISCMLLSVFSIPSVRAQTQKGPRSGKLDIGYFAAPFSCFNALQAGTIDMMAWPLDDNQYLRAISDSNIIVTPLTGTYMMYGVNFNVNETIGSYGDVNSPLSNETFRKAIACLINKDYMIANLFNFKAERIDVPIPASQSDWWNTSVTYPNYAYEFNPTRAEQLLDSAGFVRGGDGWRNYPLDWKPPQKAGATLDPIIFYVDCWDSIRVSMAEDLKSRIEYIGIKVDLREYPAGELYGPILVDHDYQIYMGSQMVNSIPIYLAILGVFVFMDLSFGNQMTYANLWEYWSQWYGLSGIGAILQNVGLTDLYAKMWHSMSYDETMRYVKLVQGICTENCFEVPICSVRSYFAYRKNIAGVVNENGYGIDNPYTFLNAYRTDDSNEPIRVGLVRYPFMLNILQSIDYFDYQCLDKIYAGLIQENPYNQALDMPWIAQDWRTSSWIDPDDGQTKTVVTYYLRKDAYWVKPVTGAQNGSVTARDYEFTCYYIYAQSPFIPELSLGCPHLDKFKYIHHVEVINDYCVNVYMDISSAYAYKLPIYPLLPKHVWLKEPLAHNNSAIFAASQIYYSDGTIPLNEYVVSGSQDTKIKAHLTNGQETWLTYGTDFMWKKGNITLLTYSINGVDIDWLTVYYWTTGSNTGYLPGEQNWQDILEGCEPITYSI